MKRGFYVVSALDPLYGELAAMQVLGQARFHGERFDELGVKRVAFEVLAKGAARPNAMSAGSVRIGHEFFTTALRDYQDWQEKWWREAIQNSVDAGATEVVCEVHPNAGGPGHRVMCADNGRGMDRETILDKFLVLGGTTKTSGETTGGFGKAKELLILPWLEWSIESRNVIVRGHGIEYTVEDRDEYVSGTILQVVMPETNCTSDAEARAFIAKCHIPRVRFSVNDEPVRANLGPGEELRCFGDKAILSLNRRGQFRGQLLVRSNGLYMFTVGVDNEIQGTLVLELKRSSVELLTANRDGFRDSDLRWGVNDFTRELAKDVKSALAKDVKSALAKKKGLIKKKYKGTGRFKAESEESLIAEALRLMESAQASKQRVLAGSFVDGLAAMLDERAGAEQPEREVPDGAPEADEAQPAPPLNFRPSGELAHAMLDGLESRGPEQVEVIAAQMAWEPDFYLVNELEGYRVPKRFYSEHMAPNVRKLLRFWAELCRFVLIQLGSRQQYGVGFIFSSDALAECRREEGEYWLMLNPFRGGNVPAGEQFRLTDRDDVAWLYAAAVHECTHMADGVNYHDESFSSAFTKNVAKTSGKMRYVQKILKAVRSR